MSKYENWINSIIAETEGSGEESCEDESCKVYGEGQRELVEKTIREEGASWELEWEAKTGEWVRKQFDHLGEGTR